MEYEWHFGRQQLDEDGDNDGDTLVKAIDTKWEKVYEGMHQTKTFFTCGCCDGEGGAI